MIRLSRRPLLKPNRVWAVRPTMGRHKDLDERLDLALGARGPATFDRTISRAMRERRQQFLDRQDTPEPDSDTATIRARLAQARGEPLA